jgi:urease accessory protein
VTNDEQRATPSDVGRVGELVLDYDRHGRETLLARSHCRSPWHLLPPIQLDDTGASYTVLVNPSGGLVGGDRLSVKARLGPGTHVLVSTPSANRVYRSLSEPSVQTVELTVGSGAVLEWVPEVTIPFAGSRFHQRIHVTLAEGATLLLWDVLASGRVARGERWAFTDLANEIRIETADGKVSLERVHLVPGDEPDRVGLAGDWNYVGSFYVVGDHIGAEVWKKLEDRMDLVLEEKGPAVLGGLSEPPVPGLLVKLVAKSAPALTDTIESLWSEIRSCLWNQPLPALRRY